MGSKSTFLSGKFGGFVGRALKKGDVLHVADLPTSLGKIGVCLPSDWIPVFEKEVTMRVVPGPQDHHFTTLGFQTFRSSFYQVTSKCDRMGIRLEGPRIERRPDVEESIISESLIPGSIQVPGDGRPMVILNELVTGGYTKIATIVSTDLPKAAQLKPGDRVRFEPVPVAEGHRLLKEQEERLGRFKGSLKCR
jgi:allophanate hydrolase subunit 2